MHLFHNHKHSHHSVIIMKINIYLHTKQTFKESIISLITANTFFNNTVIIVFLCINIYFNLFRYRFSFINECRPLPESKYGVFNPLFIDTFSRK